MDNPIFKLMNNEYTISNNPQNQLSKNNLDQIEKKGKMSLQTKIELNLINFQFYSGICKYLNLNDESFLIYNFKEIFLFNKKNLSYKKIFPLNNNEKSETYIKLVKYINKDKFLFLNFNDLYIYFLIKSKKIFPSKIIKFEKDQIVLDAIELKNGMILAITKNDILNIKINDDKYEIVKLFKFPEEYLFKDKDNYNNGKQFKLSIYELPKNNILISSVVTNTISTGYDCMSYYYSYKTREVIISLDNFIIIKELKDIYSEHQYCSTSIFKIVIFNIYICSIKSKDIYIYDVSHYDLIKIINVFNINGFMGFNNDVYNYDDNILLVYDYDYLKNDLIIFLYDITDIKNIKYQKLYYERMKIKNEYNIPMLSNMFSDIIKISEGKMLAIFNDNIFIFKYIKCLQSLTPQMQQQIEVKQIDQIEQIKEKQKKQEKEQIEQIEQIQKKEPFIPRKDYNNFINVFFIASIKGENLKFSLQIGSDEKVSTLIQKYRNKSGDLETNKNFIYNAKILNPSLNCAEARLSDNSSIFVINTRVIEGALSYREILPPNKLKAIHFYDIDRQKN